MTGWSGQPWDPAGDPVYPEMAPYPPPYPPLPYPRPASLAEPGPGLGVASAVLAFIDAGLLILSGALLVLGASLASDLANSLGDSTAAFAAEFTVDGLLDLVAAGLLIAGGVNLLAARPVGRVLLSAGCGIVLIEGLYWPARFPVGAVPTTVVWDVLFSTLAVLVVGFAWVPSVSQWLRGKSG